MQHHTTRHDMRWHNITPRYPTLPYVTLRFIASHFISLHYFTLHTGMSNISIQYVINPHSHTQIHHKKISTSTPKFHGESSTVFLLTPEVEGKFLISRHIQISSCRIIYTYIYIYIYIYSQPWINKPLGCLIGRVPFKYQIMTIGGIPA